MKRIFTLLLAGILCFGLCACGKSAGVKNVEAMIDALGDITLESADAIASAVIAYNELTTDERDKVGNYEILSAAQDRFCELNLIGEWSNTYIDFWNVESMYDRVSIELYEDMTFFLHDSDFQNGTWQVSEQQLVLSFDENNIMVFSINDDSENYRLTNGDNHYLKKEAFHARLDDTFLIVELADTNVNDYCELYIMEHIEKDAFDTPTGYSKTYAMIGSRAYQDGWCCYNGTDVAIEVLFPEHQVTHTFKGGSDAQRTEAAYTATTTFNVPFAQIVDEIGSVYSRGEYTSDLTAEQLSFGRAKGTLYYINLDYVKEFTYLDKNNRGITLIDGSGLSYSAWDEDLWNEDHPY